MCHYETCLIFLKEISYWLQIPSSLLTSGNWVELIPALISTICYKFPPEIKIRLHNLVPVKTNEEVKTFKSTNL
jgi:hypothetical protein